MRLLRCGHPTRWLALLDDVAAKAVAAGAAGEDALAGGDGAETDAVFAEGLGVAASLAANHPAGGEKVILR